MTPRHVLPLTVATLLLGGGLGALALPVAPAAATVAETSPAAPQPANLLTGDTATFAGGTGAWVAQNATLSAVGGALRITTVAAGWSMVRSGTGTAGTPGRVYTAQVDAKAETTGRQVLPYVTFYDAAGTKLAEAKGQIGTDTTTAWTTSAAAVAVAPDRTAKVAVGVLDWGTAAGEAHLVTAPRRTVTAPAGRVAVGALTTVGNTVRDAQGPIVLRGVHRNGVEASSTPISTYEMAQARRWGANTVRLPVAGPLYTQGNCAYDATYAARVDSAVANITGAGLVALLDLHTSSPQACGTVRQQLMADTSMLAFWDQAAHRFASNPHVAFDLYNEPHNISDSVWLRGGPVTANGVSYTAIGMQQMYDTVRNAGAQNLVVVSGNDWANRLPTLRVKGTNIVYGVHAYTCPATPTDCTATPFDPTSILGSWVAPSASVPVMVSEFGYPSPTDGGPYLAAVTSFARAHNWGWTAFSWDGYGNGTWGLLADAADGGPFMPTPAGMPVVTALTLP
jgi:hypothetical protein